MFEKGRRPAAHLPLQFAFEETTRQVASIRVVGVGGAGGNAINRMIESGIEGVEFYAVNTDFQALDHNKAPHRIQIGKNLTKGMGAGGDPEIGRKAIEENKDVVIDALAESDMVFITCGMGGGTGTGAAPVVAEIAKDLGALTVGVVTTPFEFEGKIRRDKAERGVKVLREMVDTLIVVPNTKILGLVPRNTPLNDALRVADEVLMHATKGISDVINKPGLINVDFADVRTVMSQAGEALMGAGIASGENRAQEAAERAIKNPLIEEISIAGAMGILVNITGGNDLSITDVSEAMGVIQAAAGDEAYIVFGAVIDPSMTGQLCVTVIATGFLSGKSTGKRVETKENPREIRISRDIPLIHTLAEEPLEQVMGEILGQDGAVGFGAEGDLNIPTFIRRGMVH